MLIRDMPSEKTFRFISLKPQIKFSPFRYRNQ